MNTQWNMNLRPGDTVYVEDRMWDGIETFSAKIHSVSLPYYSERQKGTVIDVTYGPSARKDSIRCGHGLQFLRLDGPQTFGWQTIRKV